MTDGRSCELLLKKGNAEHPGSGLVDSGPPVGLLTIARVILYSFTLFTLASHGTVLIGGNLHHLVLLVSILAVVAAVVNRYCTPCDLSDPTIALGSCRQDQLVMLVLVAAVVLTLVAHRPDRDDSLYLNISVAAADDPSAPILTRPSLHSISEPRYFLPNYKLHSLEMLVAAVAAATGIEPITLFHLVVAPIAAGLCILAYGMLFRRLAPGRHGQAVLAAFVFLVAMGDAHRSLGNFAFVRLHQGKGILVSVMVPILIYVGLAFAQKPGRRQWLDLCAAQIAAIGLTANGLVVGPSVAGLAVLSGLVARRQCRYLKTIAWAVAASAYPVAAGVIVRIRMQYVFDVALGEVEATGPMAGMGSFLLAQTEAVFGAGPFAWFCLALVLVGWRLADSGEARAVSLVFPLSFLLIFMNPLLVPYVARFVVSGGLFWRVFWTLPLAVLAGTAAVGLLRWGESRRGRVVSQVLYVAMIVLVLVVLPQRSTLSAANGTRIGVPGHKVPPEFDVALLIRENCPEKSNVLAPLPVSAWITTLAHHPYPLLSRRLYAYSLGEERATRLALTRLVGGEEVRRTVWDGLPEELSRLKVSCVVFAEEDARLTTLPDVLSRAGYQARGSVQGYGMWHHENTSRQ